MMPLRELQAHWKNYIFSGSLTSIKPELAGDAQEERLEIYSGAYEARLLEAMQKIFPFLSKYLQQDKFEMLTMKYLEKYPSTYYSIGRIGENFSSYLLHAGDVLYADIAKLEWAVSFAVDAKDAVILKEQNLQAIPQEDWGHIVFSLHPSCQLLSFDTDALNIYQKNKRFNKKALQQGKKKYARVWRKGIQVFYLSLSEIEYLLLSEIAQKKSFSDICEVLSSKLAEDKVVNYTLTQLIQWLTDELLTGAQVIK